MPAARKAVAPVTSDAGAPAPVAARPVKRIRLSRALAATARALEQPIEVKPKKARLQSNRCTMPAGEYAQLIALKKRLIARGIEVRKNELLRAGLKLLAEMDDALLMKLVVTVEAVGGKGRRNGKHRPAAAADAASN